MHQGAKKIDISNKYKYIQHKHRHTQRETEREREEGCGGRRKKKNGNGNGNKNNIYCMSNTFRNSFSCRYNTSELYRGKMLVKVECCGIYCSGRSRIYFKWFLVLFSFSPSHTDFVCLCASLVHSLKVLCANHKYKRDKIQNGWCVPFNIDWPNEMKWNEMRKPLPWNAIIIELINKILYSLCMTF